MVEHIAENIYRIGVTLPNNPLKELNSYLIRDEAAGSLLIDTGFRMEQCRADLMRGLAELDVDTTRMDIFLTHLHSDHAGLAPELIAPGRSIFISAVDRPGIEDGALIAAHWAEQSLLFRAYGVSEDVLASMAKANPAVLGAPEPGCKQYVSVEPGDVFERGGYRLRAVATPGHTPGHLCLWAQEQQILFCGDHVLFDITPNITAWPSLPDALGSYLQSLEESARLPVKLALPGHRKTGDFAARVAELQEHHRVRLAEAARIVAEEPGLTGNDITARMQWSIRARSWAEFPPAQKIFAIGEACAHLDHLEAQNIVGKETEHGVWRYFSV